jgi:hypothetical protein
LLLTEPHAPTVCDKLEVIFRRAIAEFESQEQNFCSRCGKRSKDIHTCTPPQRTEQEPQIAINAQVVGYVEPQRTWVGLTQNEIKSCWLGYEARGYPPERVMMFYKLVEVMLKEKNT